MSDLDMVKIICSRDIQSNREMFMIKVKYKRKSSNFMMRRDPVLYLKEGYIHIKRKRASILTGIIGFEDYSDLLIFIFILFYIFSNYYTFFI